MFRLTLFAAEMPWPPALPGATNGTVTVALTNSLTLDLAYHTDLPSNAVNARLWSAWGDICMASNGAVYCGIGDHGKNLGHEGQTFLYRWDPTTKTLTKLVDLNATAGVQSNDPCFTKIHAGIVEGRDGKVYFTGTLNSGGTAGAVAWTARVPGGLIYQFNPVTSQTAIIGNLKGRVTATTLLDRERNVLYCCLEGHGTGAALAGFDLTKREFVYISSNEVVVADRNLALDRQGNVYFNGKGDKLWKYDPRKKTSVSTGVGFPKEKDGQPTMRASTVPTKAGWIYGATMKPGRLFRYHPAKNKLEMLGPDFGAGSYTAVIELSPDERFLYYLPGAHGSALKLDTPVVQYEIATGKRKVLAFLRAPLETELGFVPAGTYGIKLSADGATLYVNFNGHARDDLRPPKRKPNGFGLTAFAAIHIPPSER